MKKTLFALFALVMTVAACTDKNEYDTRTFRLSAVLPEVKTLYAPPYSVAWEDDDLISVIVLNDASYSSFQFAKSPVGNEFVCELFDATSVEEFYAVYPYSAEIGTIDAEGFTEALAIGNSIVQNGLSDAGHVKAPLCGWAAATGTAPVIGMKHASTLFEVKVSNNTSDAVTISSVQLANELGLPMSGTFQINPKTGQIRAAEAVSYSGLEVSAGVLEAGSTASFYLVSAPFSLAQGQKVLVTLNVDGNAAVFEKEMPADVEFAAGAVNHTSVELVPASEPAGLSLNKTALSYDFFSEPNPASETLVAAGAEGAVTWSTSDKYVANVTEEGVVSAVGHGKAVITATDGNGATAECIVSVKGVKDLNYGSTAGINADGYYNKLYLPVNITVIKDEVAVVQTWLDRNLGASAVAADGEYAGYGSLFQWSRKADGHEQVNWTSITKGTLVNKDIEKGNQQTSRENPASNKFIYFSGTVLDWVEDEASDQSGLWGGGWKWGGVDQTYAAALDSPEQANNPCPTGYRLPSGEEMYLMMTALTGQTIVDDKKQQIEGVAATLLNSALHIPTPGFGSETSGNVSYAGNYCVFWSNSPSTANTAGKYVNARRVFFSKNLTSNNFQTGTYLRARGGTVRCIRDTALDSTEL